MMPMSDETNLPTLKRFSSRILLLELAVPVLSFGGVILALLFSGPESAFDIRYFALGCVMGSVALAYLAWIRPRKDIVALTTPVYSVLFFVVPSDFAVNVILELLYAVSLTILLIRLKVRFGTATEPGMGGKRSLEEPLKTYCETIRGQANGLNPEVAHSAAVVFARFARGDYQEAAQVAGAAETDLAKTQGWPLLITAFDIVREQALFLEESKDRPEQFIEFSASDTGLLAKSLPRSDRLNERYEVSLDNALLLLFAVAWAASEKDQRALLGGQSFALKLFAS